MLPLFANKRTLTAIHPTLVSGLLTDGNSGCDEHQSTQCTRVLQSWDLPRPGLTISTPYAIRPRNFNNNYTNNSYIHIPIMHTIDATGFRWAHAPYMKSYHYRTHPALNSRHKYHCQQLTELSAAPLHLSMSTTGPNASLQTQQQNSFNELWTFRHQPLNCCTEVGLPAHVNYVFVARALS